VELVQRLVLEKPVVDLPVSVDARAEREPAPVDRALDVGKLVERPQLVVPESIQR
jgi:hypothetical protein